MFGKLLSSLDTGSAVDVFTVIDCTLKQDNEIGKMLLVYADRHVEGELGADFEAQLLTLVNNTEWVNPKVVSLENSKGNAYRLFWDRAVTRPRAIVFGGGHVSQPLVQLLFMIDFDVTVIDDRPEFANSFRFPGARVICQSFEHAVKNLMIDRDTAVIIVTRGHRYDLECLRATMNSNARYLGMIGSRKRVRECLTLVKDEGAPEGLEKRLKAPIGLDIKAETPAEIAVSIVAEVISVFRGGTGCPMSQGKGAL